MQSYYAQLAFTVLLVVLFSSAQCQEQRLAGWNKANGLWGKRSVSEDVFESQQKRPENWAKLNTLWGKRASDPSDSFNSYLEKRLSQRLNIDRAQWQMANGLWGR